MFFPTCMRTVYSPRSEQHDIYMSMCIMSILFSYYHPLFQQVEKQRSRTPQHLPESHIPQPEHVRIVNQHRADVHVVEDRKIFVRSGYGVAVVIIWSMDISKYILTVTDSKSEWKHETFTMHLSAHLRLCYFFIEPLLSVTLTYLVESRKIITVLINLYISYQLKLPKCK